MPVKNNELTVRAASPKFNIPLQTLAKRIKFNILALRPLGPSAQLGMEAEMKLASTSRNFKNMGLHHLAVMHIK